MINPKNICKYIALFVIISILLSALLSLICNAASASGDAAADTSQSIPVDKTQIQSVIPYVEKTDNGEPKNVPIESREDMTLNPGSVYLKAQIYLNSADATKYYGSQVYIFKLLPYQEITDISAAAQAANFNVQSSEGFSYSVSIPAPDLSDLQSGEIFNKFVAGVKDGDLYVPISEAQYISNINYLTSNGKRDVPPVSKTKKGLLIQMPGEARMLGVEYTTVTIYLNDLMSAEEGPNTELYVYQNQNYYFNIDKFLEYDKQIKYFTTEGINVTAVLLINASGFTPSNQTVQTPSADGSVQPESLVPANPIEYIIHPNALLTADSGVKPFYYGINTKDERGVRYFEALMSFIADRYVKEGGKFGRIYNIILGSDIGRAMYNYCGKTDIISYIKDYMRALRICDTAIRSRFGGSRVYVPFDNWFTAKSQTEGDFTFINKEVIDWLCDYSRKEGNFIWNIAWKAYNADILNPSCWTETVPVGDYSTPVITMKNINVLCDYINLEKKDYLPNGELRKVMLSNQGFSSGDNSIGNRDLQAASFVYAYLKIRYMPDITAFIYHGQVDNTNENSCSFGLWTNAPGTVNEPGEPKKIYDVFKYMDTNREAEKIEFAKAVLGIADFKEITPQYSPDSAPAVILTEVTGETIKNTKSLSATNIGIFGSDKLSGFNGTSNISTISRVAKYDNPDSAAFDGVSMLFAGFTAPIKGDFGGIYKTYTSSEAVLNLKDEKYVGVKLRIDTDIAMPEEQKIQMFLIMESEPQSQSPGVTGETTGSAGGAAASAQNSGGSQTISVFEGLANIPPNKDEIIYFDISSWDGRTNIKKIKLLVNPYVSSSGYADVSGETAGLPIQSVAEGGLSESNNGINSKYDFNLYVYSIVSAHTSKMSSFQTILTIVVIIVCIAAAGYAALVIRARRIKKRRRELELQRRRRAKAAASRQNAQPQVNNQSGYTPPPRNAPPRKPPNSSPNLNSNQSRTQRPPQNRIPPNNNINNPNNPNNTRPRNPDINRNGYDNTGKK